MRFHSPRQAATSLVCDEAMVKRAAMCLAGHPYVLDSPVRGKSKVSRAPKVPLAM